VECDERVKMDLVLSKVSGYARDHAAALRRNEIDGPHVSSNFVVGITEWRD
jgi:hypothetical protein